MSNLAAIQALAGVLYAFLEQEASADVHNDAVVSAKMVMEGVVKLLRGDDEAQTHKVLAYAANRARQRVNVSELIVLDPEDGISDEEATKAAVVLNQRKKEK